MSAVVALAVFVAIPAGVVLGIYMGRTWSSLPSLRPGASVAFRGPQVGMETRLSVQTITSERGSLTVLLHSDPETGP